MNRTKVLFVAEELSMNGAMKSLISLLKALPKDKYDVSLFLFKHGGELANQLPDDVYLLPEMMPYAIYRLPLKKAISYALRYNKFNLALFRIIIAFERAIKSNYFGMWNLLPDIPGHYDLVCGYADGFVAPTIIKKTDAKKKANWIHYTYSNWAQAKYVYKALIESDLCIPVSKVAGKDLDEVLGVPTRQHVIHNITDIDECLLRAAEPVEVPRTDGIIRIVSVGRVTPQKNFHIIPDIAQILLLRNIKFEWYIIGYGDEFNELVSSTKELHLEHYVHFIGSRTNPMPWINSADIFVNPSNNESWGMTVSEALCLGKVVIASDIPVFAEQITDGVNGLMCDSEPIQMANTICKIIENPDLRKKLEENASKYPFSKHTIIEEFNQITLK